MPAPPAGRDEQWDWGLIASRCRREALRIVRQHHDAEEVLQEALARAWRSRHSCRNPEAPLPWCLQITRNEAIRALAHRRRAPPSEPIDHEIELEDGQAGPRFEHLLDSVSLAPLLDALAPPERALVRLRYEEDCSHPEIAAALEISEATARVRLHRLHGRLRELLISAGYSS
jgi:RNA polymerase sigma factor (sigma-70 family)